MNKKKLLWRVLAGQRNVRFGDLCALVEAFGFRSVRINGSHHIFVHAGVPEPLNLQDRNGQAKPYQVRQFIALMEQYHLVLNQPDEDEEEQ